MIHNAAAVEFGTSERCYITEWLNSEADESFSIARARVEPGVTTRWHVLDGIAERYLVLEGEGLVEVGDLSATVWQNDVVVIPPGVRQRIENTGDGDLVFLALCTPRFRQEAYREVEP